MLSNIVIMAYLITMTDIGIILETACLTNTADRQVFSKITMMAWDKTRSSSTTSANLVEPN